MEDYLIVIRNSATPKLTTIQQLIIEMGCQAAKMLIQQIHGKEGKENLSKEVRILPHKIIVIESCLRMK
ncbi:MAG: hypothetical protein ACQEWV_07600 [Bacillota bacterium]